MMDKGQNEKAALLLEKVVQDDPNNREAKILLASAYMGVAGIDIYKLHDTFKDVIFNQPLSDRFWGKSKSGEGPLDTGDVDKIKVSSKTMEDETPAIEDLIDNVDRILLKTKKVIEFLNRFPDVPRDKWPLLDSGLELLDQSGNDRDLCLYRVFFRVIYVKAYIGQEFLRNPDIPRKKWLCNIDLNNLRASVDWILKHLTSASEDFRRVFPRQSASINAFEAMSQTVQEELTALDHSRDGTNTGMVILQGRFRSVLRCGQ